MNKLIVAELYRAFKKREFYLITVLVMVEGVFSAGIPQTVSSILQKRMNYEFIQIFAASFWLVKFLGNEFTCEMWISYTGIGQSRKKIFISRLVVGLISSAMLIGISIIIPIFATDVIWGMDRFVPEAMGSIISIFLAKSFICMTVPAVAVFFSCNNIVSLWIGGGGVFFIFRIYDYFLSDTDNSMLVLLISLVMCAVLLKLTVKRFEHMDLS